MGTKWSMFDSLTIPMLFVSPKGQILYKNALAREMNIMRVGSCLVGKMEEASKEKFCSITQRGAILSILGGLDLYRALAFPATIDGTELIALLFPEVLLGKRRDAECETLLLRLVPSLRALLCNERRLPYVFDKSLGKKSANLRLFSLARKILDLYLSQSREEDGDIAIGISYFLSVLTYFFREVFRHQGVSLSVSETATECPYVFYEHRKLTALFLSLIELIIDRTGSHRMYIDIYSEAGQAVIMLSAVLDGEWAMPDETLPDTFMICELLRRCGIDFEFFTAETNDTPRMVCRLFLPSRIAKQNFAVHSQRIEDEFCVIDFLEYLASAVICVQ